MWPGRRITVSIVVAGLVVGGAFVWRAWAHDGGRGGVRRVPWHLISQPVDATVKVEAYFGGSSCSHFDSWKLTETDATVVIEVRAWFSGADVCTADLATPDMSFHLTRPLGDRRLVGRVPGDDAADCTEVVAAGPLVEPG